MSFKNPLGQFDRRRFLRGLGGAAALGATLPIMGPLGARQAMAGPGTVNWLAWSSYALPEQIKSFADTTDFNVNFIPFNENSEAFTRIKAGGGSQIDLVMGDGFWPTKYYEDGLTQAVDLNKVSSSGGLFPAFRDLKMWQADGGLHAYPNAWAPFVLIYNKKHFSSPPTSWDVLLDPALKGRVSMRGGVTYALGIAGVMLGFEPFDMTPEQLVQARDLLIKLKGNLKQFSPSANDTVRMLTDESVWIACESAPGQAWRVKEAGGPDVDWVVPDEGTIGWVDGDVLTKSAPNPQGAYEWISHRGNPENHAQLISKVFYGPTNKDCIPILRKMGLSEVVDLLRFDNPEEAVAKMRMIKPPSDTGAYTDAYNEVLAG